MLSASSCPQIKASVCYCAGEEVWSASKDGTIHVYEASSSAAYVGKVSFAQQEDEHKYSDDVVTRVVVGFTLVHRRLWGITANGDILIFHVSQRREVERIRGPFGLVTMQISPKEVPKPICIAFNGWLVVLGMDAPKVVLLHPGHKQVYAELNLQGICTAVHCMDHFIVVGDGSGGLYLFDAETLDCVAVLNEGHGGVRRLLWEPITETLWAYTTEGRLYSYTLKDSLRLKCVVQNVGHVIFLDHVSGVLVVLTKEKQIMVVDAASGRPKETMSAVPGGASGVHLVGGVKVRQQHDAFFWAYARNGFLAQEWQVKGLPIPPEAPSAAVLVPRVEVQSECPPAMLESREQEEQGKKEEPNCFVGKVGSSVEEERMKKVLMRETMRATVDECKELRLQLLRVKELMSTKDLEILDQKKRIQEQQIEMDALRKELISLTASKVALQSELSGAKAEVNNSKNTISTLSTEKNKAITEKNELQIAASNAKTEKLYAESQLMDAQNTVAGLRAENERLCRSLAFAGGVQDSHRMAEKRRTEDAVVESSKEVQAYRKLNRLLTGVLATMEYTLRRKEAEEHDLTCLLNAFRHRMVDQVTDPHLTALLQATMIRNPGRFSHAGGEAEMAEIRDRSDPLQEFFRSLHVSDPDSYNKFVLYLQKTAVADNTTKDETGAILDRFITLAASTTSQLTEEALASFRRSIPLLFVSDAQETPSVPPGAVKPDSIGSPHSPTGTATAPGSPLSSLNVSTMATAKRAKQEEDTSIRILRHYQPQTSLEDEEGRKLQQTLEFILTTRRGLVDHLAYVLRRIQMAHLACDSLTAPSWIGGVNGGASSGGNGQLITGITGELHGVVQEMLRHYLTIEEQTRVNIA